ncbi:MAG: acetyl-CoA carboxylase carboxyltransferase subunit beta [Clostridia bacterium]|nr:acetyl-CoA carboxylase carboxyltransferase subunit beta [Clostridia bacterium]
MEHFFSQRRQRFARLRVQRVGTERDVPKKHEAKAVFGKCPGCGALIPKAELARTLYVCPKCGFHHPIGAYLRLSMLLDSGSFRELDEKLTGKNPLAFPGYDEKLAAQRRGTGLNEAVVTARGKVDKRTVVIAVLDSHFMMGSMSAAVGEKVTRAVEYAQKLGCPLVICSASGGARMQEGILSLMQMAKTSAAVRRFSDAGGLYVSILTHPTTGGVTASFASLGDVTLAEPGALIGFAGPRVIEQTIGQTLPDGFQTAEYLEAHGFVDRIVPRAQLRDTVSLLLKLHEKGGRARG